MEQNQGNTEILSILGMRPSKSRGIKWLAECYRKTSHRVRTVTQSPDSNTWFFANSQTDFPMDLWSMSLLSTGVAQLLWCIPGGAAAVERWEDTGAGRMFHGGRLSESKNILNRKHRPKMESQKLGIWIPNNLCLQLVPPFGRFGYASR